MPTQKLVVCHKGEDTSWTSVFNLQESQIHLMDVTDLPGDFSAGYLTYIIDNYENLDDYTWFLKGSPIAGFGQTPLWPMENIATVLELDCDLVATTQFNFNCEQDPGYCETFANIWSKAQECTKFTEIISHIGRSVNHPGPWNWFNQFLVSKRCILSKPKTYYVTLLDLIKSNEGNTDELMALVFHDAFLKGLDYRTELRIGSFRPDTGYCKYYIS